MDVGDEWFSLTRVPPRFCCVQEIATAKSRLDLINSREVLRSSEDSPSEQQVKEELEKKAGERRRIRDERLDQYAKSAQAEQDFRTSSAEGLQKMTTLMERSVQSQERLTNVLEGYVAFKMRRIEPSDQA